MGCFLSPRTYWPKLYLYKSVYCSIYKQCQSLSYQNSYAAQKNEAIKYSPLSL